MNDDFSQFDRDSMDRYMTAAYINQGNLVLARLMASPRSGEISSDVAEADGSAHDALAAYEGMHYRDAVAHAKQAYQQLIDAAGRINVPIEPESWQADYRSRGDSFMFSDRLSDRRRTEPEP